MLSRFMKIILKIISKIVAGYLNCSYLWCKKKGKNIMKTYSNQIASTKLIIFLSVAFLAGVVALLYFGNVAGFNTIGY